MLAVTFVCAVLCVAWVSAFLIVLAEKIGWREWLQVHADYYVYRLTKTETDFFNRLFSCNFCCAWWVSVIVSVCLFLLTGARWMLLVPFCSTIIARNKI